MTTFYRKVGRRYVPVLEHDPELMDALPPGDHLISVRQNSESRRHRIDPAFAPMIAAGMYAEDAIVRAIFKAQSIQPEPMKLTRRQQELVRELTSSMRRQDARWLRPSSRDAAEAAVRALTEEAQRRMKHPAVRKAYEDFLLVARLCEDRDDTRIK